MYLTAYELAALRTKIAGRKIIASVSGGKDSAALSLWLTEHGFEHERVFLDTGWEADATYEYLRNELPAVIGDIRWERGERQMEELILSKGMFPSRTIRFCTEHPKVLVMQNYINKRILAGEELINAVGIRHAESEARSKMPQWEFSEGFDCEVWRPLISWKEQDVINIHTRHNLRPNPLYLLGASRVGCWPCIFARKSEIRLIADADPERIDRIRRLEARVAAAAEKRWWRSRVRWRADPQPTNAEQRQARFERLFVRQFQAPAWFQAQSKAADGTYPMVPIDEAVKWARTSHGGKQFDMFAAAGRDAGCMRWGLCDTNPDDEVKP